MVVGLLTGFFGVGGGFVIVPALTLLLGFPMRVAVGTSLLIITLIALTGVLAYARLVPLDLRVLSLLISGAIMGMLAGRQVSRALSPRLLTRAFAVVAWAAASVWMKHPAARATSPRRATPRKPMRRARRRWNWPARVAIP